MAARTAAQDTVLRMALLMMAADTRAQITVEQRAWLVTRLQAEDGQLSDCERARLKAPLLAYMEAYHPRVLEIVAQQFVEPEIPAEVKLRLDLAQVLRHFPSHRDE